VKRVTVLLAGALLGALLASNASPARGDLAPCGLTPPVAPTITTPTPPAPVVSYPAQPASSVAATAATLNGLVDAGTDGASVAFEYGASSDYGTCTSASAVSGTGPQPVAAQVVGLAPATTYHFRLDATSVGGTTLGADESFTTPASAPPPAQLARGVTVGGVRVGGLTNQAATRAVRAAYAAPLQFRFKGRRWKATPAQLGARPAVDAAVRRALTAPPGTRVPVRVSINGGRVSAYVAYLARMFSKRARAGDARLVGRRAVVTQGEPGTAVEEQPMKSAIQHALTVLPRQELPLLVQSIAPPQAGKKVVVIRLGDQTLNAYMDGKTVLRTPVTTGRPALPTPIGSYVIHFRASPYTFISPWPQGSPYYYPPTTVTWAMYFYDNDFLHDDPGQPNGTYGKGSNYGAYASHGCVHVPYTTMRFLFTWLPIGATVIVAQS